MSLSSSLPAKVGVLSLGASLIFSGLGMSFFGVLPAQAANPVRVYVAGESIERRNCFANAPFTSSGSLNRPTDDNDDEYGWMIPMAERLKLRQPGLVVQFVGAQPWAQAEDYDYNAERCGFVRTPGQTSAISGSSVDSWVEQRAGELSARTYCYDVAFASRGGNDGGSSHEEYRNQLKDLVRRLARGSSCDTNPLIYVTGHMPDNQGSVSSLRQRFSVDARQVVDELRVSDPSLRVRFIDIYSAFASNQRTTAFPNPNWLSSADSFNMARIGRDGDGLHPRRLSSIYAGEVVADAINVAEFTGGSSISVDPSPAPSPAPAPTPTAPSSPAPTVTTPSAPEAPSTGSGSTPAVAALGRYDIGQPTLRDIWVDPVNGRDSNTGASRGAALQTLSAAVRLIPKGQTLTGTGYRIMLTRGEYREDSMPNYWEDYLGTAQFPIILQAADGRGTAIMRKDINSKNLRYFYLIDLNFERPEDLLHFELGDHILLRGLTLRATAAHETLKVNQSKYLYVEDSDISGADDNAIDFVAVQYGHVVGNKIHGANDWCLYAKGGSAHLRYEGNEIYDCGVGGFTAGQGTGFQYMTPPWIYYEASDIKFVNNIIHDTGTAGLGVNGGYNILFAYNTLYRVGVGHRNNRADHVFEANFGGQGCDDTEERSGCTSNLTAGGWGSTRVGQEVHIPNKNVYVYNNLFVNPAGTSAPYLLQIASPRTGPSGISLDGMLVADANLQFKGNIIADSSEDLGIGDSTGCAPSNATCNPSQLRRDNQFVRSFNASFSNVAAADFRLSTSLSQQPLPIPAFPGNDGPARVFPIGELANNVLYDRAGNMRSSQNSIGAYVMGSASVGSQAPASAVPTSPTSPTSPAPVEPGQRPDLPSPSPSVVGADLSVAVFATPYPRVAQGTNVTYRVTVRNNGPVRTENASVDVRIPASVQFVSARSTKGSCTLDRAGGVVNCRVGALNNAQSVVVTLVYKPTMVGSMSVSATAYNLSAEDQDQSNNTQTNIVTVTPYQANLYGKVSRLTQVCRGTGASMRCTVTGRLTIHNDGNKASVAMRSSVSIMDQSGQMVVATQGWAVPAIAPGGTRVYTFSRVLPQGTQGVLIQSAVDTTAKVTETNERDNTGEEKLP